MTSFSSIHAIGIKPSRPKHEASGHVAYKERMHFCHAPMIWLAIKTAENIVALKLMSITVHGLQLFWWSSTTILPLFLI